jgi:hypothetical protein
MQKFLVPITPTVIELTNETNQALEGEEVIAPFDADAEIVNDPLRIVKDAANNHKRKHDAAFQANEVAYRDIRYIKATSNSCERLFSQTKLCLVDNRKSLARA